MELVKLIIICITILITLAMLFDTLKELSKNEREIEQNGKNK